MMGVAGAKGESDAEARLLQLASLDGVAEY